MKQYTDITVLVDRSGSMETIREAMETSYNKFLKEHRKNPSTRITLIQFDDRDPQQVMYSNVPVEAADKLRLKPRGNTPLLDSLCEAIDNTGKRLASLDESDRPDQVLFVIITDGQENASRKYDRRDVNQRITHQQDRYNWRFVYLGANQDAIKEAATIGIPAAFAMSYDHNSRGIGSASASLSANTLSYTSNSSAMRGIAKALAFTEDQRDEAEKKTKRVGTVKGTK